MYKYEFPDFDYELPTIEGFEDVSWHNDVCPSLECYFSDDSTIRLWCDYANPQRREVGGKRFTVSLSPSEDSLNSGDTVFLFSSEDFESTKQYIDDFIELNNKQLKVKK